MECVICKTGTTHKGTTTYTIDKQKSLLVFRDVEADVCNNCGEAYFSLETTKKLQQLVAEALEKGVEFEVVKRKKLCVSFLKFTDSTANS